MASRPSPFIRLAAAGLGLVGLACLGLLLSPSEPVWWLINLAGASAFVLLATSSVAVPGAGAQHPARSYVRHARLGRWAVGSALLHALAIPVFDSSIWLYARRESPVDILAGVLALVALTVTAAMREPSVLTRLPIAGHWPHWLCALVALALAVGHVVLIPGTGLWIAMGLVLGAALVAVSILRWRLPRWGVVATMIAIVSASGVVFAAMGFEEARMAALRQAPVEQRMFDHASHTSVKCATCHHNFLDKSGLENCISCHKSISTDERNRIDRTFHAFCTGCHAERRMAGDPAGPIQSCAACHAKHRASTSATN